MVDKVNHKESLLAVFFVLAALFYILLTVDIPLFIWLAIVFFHLILASSLSTIIDTMISEIAVGNTNKFMVMTAYTMVVDLGAAFGPMVGYLP